jgi:hypothetical protein
MFLIMTFDKLLELFCRKCLAEITELYHRSLVLSTLEFSLQNLKVSQNIQSCQSVL